MDKQSFSRYGGIVIVVIILSMMIAFATPFGSFVVNGVKDVFANFSSTGGNAMDNDYGDFVDFPYPGTGSGNKEQTIAAGLYETGSNYTVLLTSWEDILADGTVHVENGVVYTNFNSDTRENDSSSSLVGDLVIPGDVTSIGTNAFRKCSSLTSIEVPTSVTTIEWGAFWGCAGLESMTIPNSVTSIGGSAFSYCANLTRVNLPNGITIIADNIFCGCTALTSITIPQGITFIDMYAFSECTSLESITFEGTVEQWNNIGKDSDWNFLSSATTVQCSGGTVALS